MNGYLFFLALVSAIISGSASAKPVDSAIPGNHPLEEFQAGSLLISELRCAACHAGIMRDPLHEKSAPNLTEVGSRVSPKYLRRFLVSPSSTHPASTMPDMLASTPEAERDGIAEALIHYLISLSKDSYQTESVEKPNVEEGKSLYHSVGCVACHGPRDSTTESLLAAKNKEDAEVEEVRIDKEKKTFKAVSISLAHVSAKYSTKSLSEFLFQPLHVRSSGRMPDMKLNPTESLSIAGYLIGERSQQEKALVPQESLVAKGQKYFQELNCAACHALSGITAAPLGLSLKDADMSRGCLSKTSSKSPQFRLNATQVQAGT